ncbi:MAG: hypothetical protein WDN28_20215 [Chthoniobacter sp.]
MKHLLSIESLTGDNIEAILELAAKMKIMRGALDAHPLRHKCWALIFSKSSTRTPRELRGRHPRTWRRRAFPQRQ